mgnify:FL=1
MNPTDLVPWIGAIAAAIFAWRGNKRSDFDSLRDELRKQRDEALAKARAAADDAAAAREEAQRIRTDGEAKFAEVDKRINDLEERELTLRARLHLAYDYIRVLVATIGRTPEAIPAPPAGLDIALAVRVHLETSVVVDEQADL